VVTLHCYDYFSSDEGQAFNGVLRQLGTGAFHCGVEVYDKEYSYRGRHGPGSGVFAVRPKTACRSFRESVPMGHTTLSESQVLGLLEALMTEWQGNRYDLLKRNCCHFCNEFCTRLGVGSIPEWTTHLAATGQAIQERWQAAPDDMSCTTSRRPPLFFSKPPGRQTYNPVRMTDMEVCASHARELERHDTQTLGARCVCIAVLSVLIVVLGGLAAVRAFGLDGAQVPGMQSTPWLPAVDASSGHRSGREQSGELAKIYDCRDGNSLLWISEKRHWCCVNTGRGCAFNCATDVEHWDLMWSPQKKRWCCAHVQVGCQDPLEHSTPGARVAQSEAAAAAARVSAASNSRGDYAALSDDATFEQSQPSGAQRRDYEPVGDDSPFEESQPSGAGVVADGPPDYEGGGYRQR